MNRHTKYLPVKFAIESLFGLEAWYALKESNHIPTWKKYIEKTLKSIHISIHQTVKYCDEEWIKDVDKTIQDGLDNTKRCKSIDELIAVLAGTLINMSFLQIGLMPHTSQKKVTLRKENWNLNCYRSVVYLQSKEQKEEYFWHKQQRKLGFKEQQKIRSKYLASGSSLLYSEWCEKTTKNQL